MNDALKNIFSTGENTDAKSIEFLTNALEKNNLPGFDYIEFIQSVATLGNMNLDEATAFKSSYATANTMGLTKQKLLDSAIHYKNVLINEKTQFDKALEAQMHQKVNGKLKEVAELKEKIKKYQARIQELETEMTKNQATIDNADEQINDAKRKIETTRLGFLNTHQSMLSKIDKDIQTINTLLS